MALIRNVKKTKMGYEYEGEVYFPLLDETIAILFDEVNHTYAEECAAHLLQLPPQILRDLCEKSIVYCNKTRRERNLPPLTFDPPEEVLEAVWAISMAVPSPQWQNGLPVVDLELNCDWEAEHGMEWLIINGVIDYVGPYPKPMTLKDLLAR